MVFALIAVISISSTIYAYSNFVPTQNSKLDGSNNDLFIDSFSPSTYGSDLTGGKIVLVNPTNKNFDNLTLNIRIDQSELLTPYLRFNDTPIANFISFNIKPLQNETIIFYLYNPNPSENKTNPRLSTMVNIQTFSPHILMVYVSQKTFGDLVNNQSLTIPQEKAKLQILGYSSIEHDNNTWHEQYNVNKNRQEYVNDQPNFYQQYRHSAYYPMESTSFNWAKALNQIGEHYFNVTIFNNSTFPVNKVTFYLGEGGVASALPFDKILQSNETCVIPVATGGQNWWSVESVNQLSNLNIEQAYASGDLTNRNG